MDQETFNKSAEFIAKRNVSDRVLRVVATFDRHEGRLKVAYYLKDDPMEDDLEDCELTCAELIAAFPEIKVAETMCIPIAECVISTGNVDGVVFSRE